MCRVRVSMFGCGREGRVAFFCDPPLEISYAMSHRAVREYSTTHFDLADFNISNLACMLECLLLDVV